MKPPRPRLPRFGDWILKLMARYEVNLNLRGDFDEEFSFRCETRGYIRAWLWYWTHLLRSLPVFIKDILFWRFVMIKNYLLIALRNIKRHKGYSLINIAGLSIGITTSILIMLYVQYELSFDKFHKNSNDIYRILRWDPDYISSLKWKISCWPALAPVLKSDFPEVIKATRVDSGNGLVNYKNKHFIEENIYFVDPDFLEIFTFPIISGNPQTALNEPFSMLITQKMAEKYFDNENPIDRILNYNNNDFKVTGLLKNIPETSSLQFDFLISFNTKYILRGGKDRVESWNFTEGSSFIQLKNNFNPGDLEKKFPAFIEKHLGEDKSEKKSELILQPVTRIHLYGNAVVDLETTSDIKLVYLLSAIAFCIILIACFNYMNLSAARSVKRAKEVGIRKIVGAKRVQLIRQFLGESMILTGIAILISIMLVILILPEFSLFINRKISFSINNSMLLNLMGITFFIGIISGSYPALFLSSFNPVNVIKGRLRSGSSFSSVFRKSLVVLQFAISIIMIVSTLIIYNQLTFIKNRNLGFDKDLIVTSYIRDRNLRSNFELLKNELLKYPLVSGVSFSVDLPSSMNRWTSEFFEPQNKNLKVRFTYVDYNFVDFYGMEVIKGRNFSREFSSDLDQALLINETAVKELGWGEPIGKRLFSNHGNEYTIIGVLKDFHFKPLHQKIEPLVVRLIRPPWMPNYLSLKINPENIPETLLFLEDKFKEFSPDYPFEYSFFDERINNAYKSEQKLGKIFNYFALISLFIACLGLFGLASFTSEQRTKEIGIRKVVGASVSKIFVLLSKEFIKRILIANIIAWPIAYFAMNKWLQNFAYRINIGIGIFLTSGLIALVIAMLTISYQSIKAATANPVDSLRYE